MQQLRLSDAGQAMPGHPRSAAEAREAAITSGRTVAQQAELRDLLQTLSELLGLDADVRPGYQEPRGTAGTRAPSTGLAERALASVTPGQGGQPASQGLPEAVRCAPAEPACRAS